MKNKSFILLLLLLALLTGCDQQATIFSGLEERQANSVAAALLDNGISCSKSPGAEENTWDVVLKSDKDFARAVEICQARGLPQQVYKGVAEVFKKSGMVSSPSEERIRFMDALSQDLSRTISEIDGVINARVHVVLPDNDPFAKNVQPSSAAVAIRCRYDVDMTDIIPHIKNLVMNSIEGLAYDKIAVTVFRDTPPIVVNAPGASGEVAPAPDYDMLRLLTTICAVLAVVLAALIVVFALLVFRKRKQVKPQEGADDTTAAEA